MTKHEPLDPEQATRRYTFHPDELRQIQSYPEPQCPPILDELDEDDSAARGFAYGLVLACCFWAVVAIVLAPAPWPRVIATVFIATVVAAMVWFICKQVFQEKI